MGKKKGKKGKAQEQPGEASSSQGVSTEPGPSAAPPPPLSQQEPRGRPQRQPEHGRVLQQAPPPTEQHPAQSGVRVQQNQPLSQTERPPQKRGQMTPRQPFPPAEGYQQRGPEMPQVQPPSPTKSFKQQKDPQRQQRQPFVPSESFQPSPMPGPRPPQGSPRTQPVRQDQPLSHPMQQQPGPPGFFPKQQQRKPQKGARMQPVPAQPEPPGFFPEQQQRKPQKGARMQPVPAQPEPQSPQAVQPSPAPGPRPQRFPWTYVQDQPLSQVGPPGFFPQQPPAKLGPQLAPQTPPSESDRSPQQQQRGPPRLGPQFASQVPPSKSGGSQQQQREQKGARRQPEPQSPRAVESLTTEVPKLTIPKVEVGQGDIEDLPLIKATPGVKGRKIRIETNHLQLGLGTLETAIHYDVNIIPDRPKKFLRTVLEEFRKKHYSYAYPAFDGRKNLYSTRLLNFGDFISDEIIVEDNEGRLLHYKVELKFANKVDLRPLRDLLRSKETPREALQVVDIVLRSAPALKCIPVGRSFFVKPSSILNLGEGMEMYNGFYQSAIRGWKPFLNVDVAHKAFPKNIPVLQAIIELLDSYYQRFTEQDLERPLAAFQRETVEKFLKNLRVLYEIHGSKRTYRVNGLDAAPKDKRFSLDNGEEITIKSYYETKKNYRLRYSHLPSLWVGSKNDEERKRILLPLELCTIVEHQAVNRKMTENQTSAMIKYAATNTYVRKDKIMAALAQANHNQNNTVKEFGFSVGRDFEKLDARILDPPEILYAKGKRVKPSRGVWRGDNFINGVTINKWTIACVDRRPPRTEDLARFADTILKNASTTGMYIATPAEKPFVTIGPRQTLPDINRYFDSQKSKNYDVIFVIVPNSGPQYAYVKTAAEINVGCLTQCIKLKTLNKMNATTAINILLKVNSKLNGKNHTLFTRPSIMNRPCMIMGADVTHPSPDSRGIPSVAAVTASHDPNIFQYNICWRLQPPKVEIIEDLEAITREQLLYFHKMTRAKPEKIIFFRDGVSEGQFSQVRREEIKAIRAACKKIQAEGFEPSITFLVVQKRHHTRFFPTNPRDSEDRNNNVPAGTCVDTTITHPFMQDFYLVSHASIQGVAKPTKYCTLWDDNNLSNDEMEELTYYLCHMFSRCNRSVSYPAPTYYAHLAAARAKVYIENEHLNMDELQQEYNRFKIRDVIRKDCPMFFV